jgi:hypothetical protein
VGTLLARERDERAGGCELEAHDWQAAGAEAKPTESLLANEKLCQHRIDAIEGARKLATNVALSIDDDDCRGGSNQPGVGVRSARIKDTRVGHAESVDECSAGLNPITLINADEVNPSRGKRSVQRIQRWLLSLTWTTP